MSTVRPTFPVAPRIFEVPRAFATRVLERVRLTGEPLLEYRLAEYSEFLRAHCQGDEFELAVDEWQPPFDTWREYAEYVGIECDELCAEHALQQSELDSPIDLDRVEHWDQHLRPYDTPTGAVYPLLEAVSPKAFRCTELNADLGHVAFTDGPVPGNDYVGVSASSAIALSCLQYALDDAACGIRIHVAAY